MDNLISINNANLTIKEYKGQRVVTFKDIDIVHQRPEGTAKRNFTDNRQHFICGEDYFKICPNEIRSNKIMNISPKLHQDVVFLTESGYLMLVKSFTDDLAWKVQRELVNTYFRVRKEPKQLKLEEKPYEYIPKFYKGIPVVTTADLEHFTKVAANSFSYHLRSKSYLFQEGVDYWLLTGKPLVEFKRENPQWHRVAKSLILFTQTGVCKLSEVIVGVPKDLPCFRKNDVVKVYKEKPIVLSDDFSRFTGVDIEQHGLFFRLELFTPGKDWNGIGQGELREKFEKDNQVHYAEEKITFMYESGVEKALRILNLDSQIVDELKRLIALVKEQCKGKREQPIIYIQISA